MRSLRYTGAAQDNFIEIALYIAHESGSRAVAEAFVQKLKARCEHLAMLPGTLGTARPELRADIRSVPCHGYVIFFRYAGPHLEIVNVLSGARDIEGYFGDWRGERQL